MKIARIETFRYWAKWKNWIFVRVETDDGLHGWGEASLAGAVDAVERSIHELGQVLIGQDAGGVERHWQAMFHTWRWRGGAIQSTAQSALDIALWDLEGKRLGVPVYRLLGGPFHTRIRAYASHWLGDVKTAEEAHAGAREAVRLGFTAFKWNPFKSPRFRTHEAETIMHDTALMEAARDGAGPGVDIFCDLGERLSARTALAAARSFAPFRPGFFEEPLPYENAKAMIALKQQMPVPIATGEHLMNRWEFRELVEGMGADILQPDLCHGGGITEVKRIATFAESHFLTMAPHNSAGPIGTAASLHLAASIPNFYILEQMEGEREMRDSICTDPLIIEDGYYLLPTKPGLGTDLDFTAIADRASQPLPIRHTTASRWH
ncbi:mandelate racemase/muconate lactonizing enzyme family protein [Neorhizobium galegae]|uniref:Galactonate dehydratase n=1 Tax=Neorhizobium galegae bv. orientalis str. HAMBI 540 TaxID=1028800 RepID=A0A068T0P6_NEOGA|nr:mandelate racemase/muconate lactonizing enzyme family protein [Neorhizobium galegae]MCQ1854602.1 mandelate racemase/muconate lactonizing enzyme family protein [Neorhizobium galegae]CDN51958.1 Galactonate dehydratase [Neorhizobium galegae bv. orientalis str. HAMBI 540]CDZ51506.1 Galactonate dehydratase [Neorhizobium galegae bv. orientalis]